MNINCDNTGATWTQNGNRILLTVQFDWCTDTLSVNAAPYSNFQFSTHSYIKGFRLRPRHYYYKMSWWGNGVTHFFLLFVEVTKKIVLVCLQEEFNTVCIGSSRTQSSIFCLFEHHKMILNWVWDTKKDQKKVKKKFSVWNKGISVNIWLL